MRHEPAVFPAAGRDDYSRAILSQQLVQFAGSLKPILLCLDISELAGGALAGFVKDDPGPLVAFSTATAPNHFRGEEMDLFF